MKALAQILRIFVEVIAALVWAVGLLLLMWGAALMLDLRPSSIPEFLTFKVGSIEAVVGLILIVIGEVSPRLTHATNK